MKHAYILEAAVPPPPGKLTLRPPEKITVTALMLPDATGHFVTFPVDPPVTLEAGKVYHPVFMGLE